ncbi:hypothetical protein [Paenibacillus sp. P3E]|nr:hypothetical protein [Paenibacillus sp. P3E]
MTKAEHAVHTQLEKVNLNLPIPYLRKHQLEKVELIRPIRTLKAHFA